MAEELVGRGLWQPVLSLTKPQLLKPLQLSQHCPGTRMQCNCKAPPHMDAGFSCHRPYSTYHWLEQGWSGIQRRKKDWIQDTYRFNLAYLKWGPRISAEDMFHQMSIKLSLLLLPALDFYSKDIRQRTHSPRLQGLHSALHVRIPEHGWTAVNLSIHSPCLLADYLLTLPKMWRGKKDQQYIHVAV